MEEKIVPEKILSVPLSAAEQPISMPSEQPRAPEKLESAMEPKSEESAATTERVASASLPAAATTTVAPASPERIEIEHILEEGLKDIYVHLPEEKKAAFKDRGEETAAEITTLLQKTTLHIVKIVKLILQWLRMIPDVDPSYLEQESKRKADKIVAMHSAGKNVMH